MAHLESGTGLTTTGIEVVGKAGPLQEQVLTREALEFLFHLQSNAADAREELLIQRDRRLEDMAAGLLPEFPDETRTVRPRPEAAR